MGIKATTPTAEICKHIQRQEQRYRRALIRTLSYCGEVAVNVARSKANTPRPYTDQTGNLRSSVGYVVAIDGRIASQSNFEKVKGSEAATDGKDGTKVGIKFAKDLVRQHPHDIVLIVVAGMEYATYVANRGYDVLASAELEADRIVPMMLKTLNV